jgi:hypothetical protein
MAQLRNHIGDTLSLAAPVFLEKNQSTGNFCQKFLKKLPNRLLFGAPFGEKLLKMTWHALSQS